MANIEINHHPKKPCTQLIVNGMDLTNEVFREGIELVGVGEGAGAEVGLRFTIAVSKLSLDGEADIQITDRFRPVAQRVRSIVEDVD